MGKRARPKQHMRRLKSGKKVTINKGVKARKKISRRRFFIKKSPQQKIFKKSVPSDIARDIDNIPQTKTIEDIKKDPRALLEMAARITESTRRKTIREQINTRKKLEAEAREQEIEIAKLKKAAEDLIAQSQGVIVEEPRKLDKFDILDLQSQQVDPFKERKKGIKKLKELRKIDALTGRMRSSEKRLDFFQEGDLSRKIEEAKELAKTSNDPRLIKEVGQISKKLSERFESASVKEGKLKETHGESAELGRMLKDLPEVKGVKEEISKPLSQDSPEFLKSVRAESERLFGKNFDKAPITISSKQQEIDRLESKIKFEEESAKKAEKERKKILESIPSVLKKAKTKALRKEGIKSGKEKLFKQEFE